MTLRLFGVLHICVQVISFHLHYLNKISGLGIRSLSYYKCARWLDYVTFVGSNSFT